MLFAAEYESINSITVMIKYCIVCSVHIDICAHWQCCICKSVHTHVTPYSAVFIDLCVKSVCTALKSPSCMTHPSSCIKLTLACCR